MASRRGMELNRKQRSVSCDRESSAASESRRSFSFERQTSVDRMSSSSLSGSVNESYSSGYASYSLKSAPQFTLPLIDQLVCVGNKCVFSVLLSTKPDIELAWYHGQTKISLTDDVRYRMDSQNCLYRLVIMGVMVNDAGDWRCLATNTYGQCISACRLDVVDAVREDARRPEFTENLSRTIVVEGGPTKLECKLSGKPVPEVRWLKDRRPLGDDVSYEMACEEDELHTLCISATYAEHAGWYSCVARNDVGTAITEAKLTVERADSESLVSANSSFDRASLTDDLESVQTRTSMASMRRRRLLMTTSPQFTARLRPKRCVVGQTVRFSCCVSGMPEPEITWSRADGTTLTNSKRFHITNNFGLCSLEITAARLEDSGLYIVKASNVEGHITCSASLQVEHDADGKRTSCSVESTPHHVDWPPVSVSIPDQSQLSREPLLPGAEAFLTAEAAHLDVSYVCEDSQFVRTKDNSQAVELSTRADQHQPVPCTTLSSPTVVEEGKEPCQETRTRTVERSIPAMFDDFVQPTTQCDVSLTAATEQSTETVVTSTRESQDTDVNVQVHSHGFDVVSSPVGQPAQIDPLPLSDSTAPSGAEPHQHAILEIGPFVQPITDQVVAVGETAKFECCLHQPSSSCDVTWWREDGEIVSGGRVQLLTTDDHLRHSLVISDVQQSDAGDYMVKLTDHLDPSLVHSSTAKLIIIPHRPVSDGADSGTSGQLSDRRSSTDQPHHTTPSTDLPHGPTTSPPAHDVICDVSGKMADDWLHQLFDLSGLLIVTATRSTCEVRWSSYEVPCTTYGSRCIIHHVTAGVQRVCSSGCNDVISDVVGDLMDGGRRMERIIVLTVADCLNFAVATC